MISPNATLFTGGDTLIKKFLKSRGQVLERGCVYKLNAPFSIDLVHQEYDPAALGPRSVVTRTLYSAISPGTELAAWRGDPPLRPTASIYPRLMGYCNVSEVRHIGQDVCGWEIGDIVITRSSHRSHDLVDVSELLCRVPKSCDLASAAITYLYHLGHDACVKGQLVSNQTMAVIGLGILGLTTVSMARSLDVTIAGYSDQVSDLPRAMGVTNLFSRSNCHKDSFDVVVVTTNSWTDWLLALQIVNKFGTIVLMGFPGRGNPLPPFNPLDSQYLYDKQLSICACGGAGDNITKDPNDPLGLQFSCARIVEQISNDQLNATSLIRDVRPAEDLSYLYDLMLHHRSDASTFVLDWKNF